jgi:phage-related protein
MSLITRPIAWVKAAKKDFEIFPKDVQLRMRRALTIAAEGQKSDIAKPMKGLGSGVFEIALKYRTDAYRAIYAVQIEEAVWVIHAFKKKPKTGIKTPKQEIDLVRQRIKAVKEILK